MIRPLCLAAAFTGIAACADRPPALNDMRAQLDRIAAKCGLPASMFELRSPDELHIRPPVDAKYENVDCALSEVKKAKLPLNLGFVGNEAYVGGNSQ